MLAPLLVTRADCGPPFTAPALPSAACGGPSHRARLNETSISPDVSQPWVVRIDYCACRERARYGGFVRPTGTAASLTRCPGRDAVQATREITSERLVAIK